jgi:hypothetical protein
MSGTAGTEWVNVAVYNSAGTKVGADVTPSGGTWSTTIDMGAVTGSQVLTATAFSVPAGQSGGTSTSVNETYIISGSLPYYGINCHYNQGGQYTSNSLAVQVSLTSVNGMTACRQDCWNTAAMQALADTVIPGMTGIQSCQQSPLFRQAPRYRTPILRVTTWVCLRRISLQD